MEPAVQEKTQQATKQHRADENKGQLHGHGELAEEKLPSFGGAGELGDSSLVGLLSKGIAGHAQEGLRIQARSERNKRANAEDDGFGDAERGAAIGAVDPRSCARRCHAMRK